MSSPAESGSAESSVRRKIWVIGEGKHEQEGALVHLVRRLIPDAEACDFEFGLWKTPRGVKRRFRSSELGDGVSKKFVAMLLDAERYGFDAVIALIDCDGDRSRIQAATKAQGEQAVPMPRAFGIAIETFDAWFLADEQALSGAFETSVNKQPSPESNSDAKASMKSLRNQSGSPLGLAELYCTLAQTSNLELVSKCCPKGFGVWKQRVEELFA